jgi:putative Mn2+ efflux pump MntP
MPPLLLLSTAVALSLDAFAVAISRGMCARRPSWGSAIAMGVVFGVFQALMPCLGWLLGVGAQGWVEAYDHWVAFVLLAAIGGKMLWEAATTRASDAGGGWPTPLGLIGLGIATSLDAFAAGVGFATLNIAPLAPALVIGAITCVAAVIGAHFGRMLGTRVGRGAEAFGGVVLIAIGGWILVDHVRSGAIVPL